MNDRELLELAAKAVGIPIEWDANSMQLVPVFYKGKTCHEWNPLTDDGDALRLAVKLEIDLTFYSEREARVYAQTKHLLGYGTDGYASYQAHEFQKEPCGADPYSATRRAIVRAAAEIGKAM